MYSKICAKCAECGCQITLSNFTKNEAEDQTLLLCKIHYFKRFHEGGSYVGGDKYRVKSDRDVQNGLKSKDLGEITKSEPPVVAKADAPVVTKSPGPKVSETVFKVVESVVNQDNITTKTEDTTPEEVINEHLKSTDKSVVEEVIEENVTEAITTTETDEEVVTSDA